MKIKKKITILLIMLSIFSLAGCTKKEKESTGRIDIDNGWVKCSDENEALNISKLEIALPKSEGKRSYRAINGQAIEITENDLVLRKGLTIGEDISGDYENYKGGGTFTITPTEKTEIIVSYKGYPVEIHVAVWAIGDYSYSISSTKGLTIDEVAEIVSSFE